MNLECEHGQLARSCNICEYEREIAELNARVGELEAENKKYHEWVSAINKYEAWKEENRRLQIENRRLQLMNPCNHTGFESAPCDVCGYPDPRKLIAKLKEENRRLIVQRDGAFARWKSAIAKYPKGADGCCCLFDADENQIQWCSPHAKLRDENQRLRAFWEWSRLADKMTFEQYHWKEANHD